MSLYTINANGREYARRAWTGRCAASYRRTCPEFRGLVRAFFREQIKEAGGRGFFVGASVSFLEWCRILWGRAVGDAWRTLEESRRVSTVAEKLRAVLPSSWHVGPYGSGGAVACYPPGGTSPAAFHELNRHAPISSVAGPLYVVTHLREPQPVTPQTSPAQP